MLRFIAKRYAKAQYRFRQLVEAETNELHAKLADQLAKEHRTSAAQLAKEADEMDARIKEVEEMELKGYWACDEGHERLNRCSCADQDFEPFVHSEACPLCPVNGVVRCQNGQPMKLIKRDQMSGQEKYESDKERGEAQDIAKQKRAQAEEEVKSAEESEKAAKYFRGISKNNRTVAERVRRA